MEQLSEQIKKDFEERIESIETHKRNKTFLYNTVLYTVSIMMFILVLCGTIFSINNYIKPKEKASNNNIKIIELKI